MTTVVVNKFRESPSRPFGIYHDAAAPQLELRLQEIADATESETTLSSISLLYASLRTDSALASSIRSICVRIHCLEKTTFTWTPFMQQFSRHVASIVSLTGNLHRFEWHVCNLASGIVEKVVLHCDAACGSGSISLGDSSWNCGILNDLRAIGRLRIRRLRLGVSSGTRVYSNVGPQALAKILAALPELEELVLDGDWSCPSNSNLRDFSAALRAAPALRVLTLSTTFVPALRELVSEVSSDDGADEIVEFEDEDNSMLTDDETSDTDSTCSDSSSTLFSGSDIDYVEPDGMSGMSWSSEDLVVQPCAVWAECFLDTYLRTSELRELRFLHHTPLDEAPVSDSPYRLVRFAQHCVTDMRTSKANYMIRYLGIVGDGPELDELCF